MISYIIYDISYNISCIMYHPPPYPPQHHHRHHQLKQVFYTLTPLQPKPFTQESLYARSPLLHQKVFTPGTSLHHQHFLSKTTAFHTKHLLLPFHFTRTSFCIRSLRAPRFCNPFSPETRTVYATNFLHKTVFTP